MSITPKERLRQLYLVGLITFVIMLAELIGGYCAGSLALMSDAAHMFTDFISLIIAVFATKLASRPKTSKLSYGFKKAKIFGAFFNGLFLWVVSAFLIYFAIQRLMSPEVVDGPVVSLIGFVGLLANLLSMKILSHSHQDNLNMKGVFLHILSDLLGSLGALVAGIVIWLTGWYPIDPILSILFTLLILGNAWGMIKESVLILMDGVPKGLDYDAIKADLENLSGVEEVHDLHLWSLSNNDFLLSVHMVSKEEGDLLNRAHQLLHDKYKITHSTIQIEEPGQCPLIY